MAKGPTVSTTFNAKDKISKPMQKMQANMKKFALVGGAAIAAAGVATLKAVNTFANAGDEIAKSARKVGVTVETLQELRFAADRSGVSAETLQNSLQKLNKNVGDLRAGTGALKTILDKTNPALAEQLKNAENNEEAFAIMTKAMAETENQMDKAALAQAAFGRAGQDLLIMTENGAEGIAQLREEARKYGNIISTEAAGASEAYIDSLTNMKNVMTSLKNNALLPLMKALQPIIQAVADWAVENRGLMEQNFQDFVSGITRVVRIFVKLWEGGFLQAIAAGVIAFKLISGAIMLYQSRLAIAAVAQAAFNAVMAANPISLIVIGIALLIAGIVLLIKNWDKVKAFFVRAWQAMVQGIKDIIAWFSKLLDNKFFVAAGLIFAPWLTIPAMIIKHWEPLMEFFKMLIEKISLGAQKVGQFFGGIGDFFNRDSGGGGSMVGRNDAALAGGGSMNSSQLAVNFNNAPAGTSFVQKGSAPGITVDTGRRGGL